MWSKIICWKDPDILNNSLLAYIVERIYNITKFIVSNSYIYDFFYKFNLLTKHRDNDSISTWHHGTGDIVLTQIIKTRWKGIVRFSKCTESCWKVWNSGEGNRNSPWSCSLNQSIHVLGEAGAWPLSSGGYWACACLQVCVRWVHAGCGVNSEWYRVGCQSLSSLCSGDGGLFLFSTIWV
jgi:hypothetical protein